MPGSCFAAKNVLRKNVPTLQWTQEHKWAVTWSAVIDVTEQSRKVLPMMWRYQPRAQSPQ